MHSRHCSNRPFTANTRKYSELTCSPQSHSGISPTPPSTSCGNVHRGSVSRRCPQLSCVERYPENGTLAFCRSGRRRPHLPNFAVALAHRGRGCSVRPRSVYRLGGLLTYRPRSWRAASGAGDVKETSFNTDHIGRCGASACPPRRSAPQFKRTNAVFGRGAFVRRPISLPLRAICRVLGVFLVFPK